jgi:1-acyl-sn-glycerol-3-phosphate acyltransferase
VNEVTALDHLDPDRVAPPEGVVAALKRRVAGRYPIDAFGLDPQLANLVTPVFNLAVPVHVSGGDHVPATGPAVIVANRGFGVGEPAALAIAVRRSTGRRLRIVGAPALPFVGGLTRRLGAISASEQDVSAALHAGYLVAVPLSPTLLRTGAGVPPHTLMPALTHAPIIPAAVKPGGPFGTTLGPWHVRFGPLVTLDEPYDPNDPLAAARFADAVRASVRALLGEA